MQKQTWLNQYFKLSWKAKDSKVGGSDGLSRRSTKEIVKADRDGIKKASVSRFFLNSGTAFHGSVLNV